MLFSYLQDNNFFSHTTQCQLIMLLLTSDKPTITEFAHYQLPVSENITVWCKANSNPPPNITIFQIIDTNSSAVLAGGHGVTEVTHFMTSVSCHEIVLLQCLAENHFESTEKSVTLPARCKLIISRTGEAYLIT